MSVHTATLTHRMAVAAPPRQVFELVADTAGAPRFAPSQVHAEIQATDGASDLVKRWVYDGRSVRSWLVRRVLRPQDLHIEFTHEAPQPPLAAQRGEWNFVYRADGGTQVRVTHTVQTAGPAALEAVLSGLDRNVPAQLKTYKFAAELGEGLQQLSVQHTDSAAVSGTVDQVVARLSGSPVWAALAAGPAVVRVRQLSDDADQVSVAVIDGGAGEASAPPRPTGYVRVRLPGTGVAYKRVDLPAGVHAEVGSWRVTPDGPGSTRVQASSWVTLDAVLTAGPGLAEARAGQHAALAAALRRVLTTVAAEPG